MDASQSLIVGVSGTSLEREEARLLRDLQPGGFILFGRNIAEPGALRKLVDDLYDLSKSPPIICIDQEGGRVARLREIGAEPPSAKELADFGSNSQIARHGELIGKLLRLFGFNLDLCPVLDISFEGDLANSLKNRCYGGTPEEVIERAGVFNRALRSQGILSCGKHFPGYSRARIDPHHDLPLIPRTEEELESWEWKPFRALLSELDSLMMGHAFYPEIDRSGIPSSLSPHFIQGVLRDRWNYSGAIMTDDLDMGAIVHRYSVAESAERAIVAGNDLVLLCHRSQLAAEALAGIRAAPKRLQNRALENIRRLKARLPAVPSFDRSIFERLNEEILALRTELVGPIKSREKTPEDANRSPVEDF